MLFKITRVFPVYLEFRINIRTDGTGDFYI